MSFDRLFDDMFKSDVIFIPIEVGSGDRTLGATWSCEAELFKVFLSHCISSHDTEIKCVKCNYTCFTQLQFSRDALIEAVKHYFTTSVKFI